MDDIIFGEFSKNMMIDLDNDDINLLTWKAATAHTNFEKSAPTAAYIGEKEYFDNGVMMIAMIKAGVKLAFKTITQTRIIEESSYYESLHELPLIANIVVRKKIV